MDRKRKIVKHRTVIDRKAVKDISQEPEMKELVRVFRDMTEGEKGRTIDYLDGEGRGRS
jgi:hypothetical protein